MKKYIEIMVVVLITITILTFVSCTGGNTATNITSKESSIQDEDVKVDYYSQMSQISYKVADAFGDFNQANVDYLNGDINISEHKSHSSIFIIIIYTCYGEYLDLNPPKEAEELHSLYREALKHYAICAGYLRKYYDSDDISEMNSYLEKAIPEVMEGNERLIEADEKLQELLGNN